MGIIEMTTVFFKVCRGFSIDGSRWTCFINSSGDKNVTYGSTTRIILVLVKKYLYTVLILLFPRTQCYRDYDYYIKPRYIARSQKLLKHLTTYVSLVSAGRD